MNENITYEQLIAQKLEQLPVPDKADAIWEAIEHQLNIVMPVNSSSVLPTKTPVTTITGKVAIIIITTAVIIAVVLFMIQTFNNNPSIKPSPAPVQIPNPQKITDSNKVTPKYTQPENNKKREISVPKKSDTSSLKDIVPPPLIVPETNSVYHIPLDNASGTPDTMPAKKSKGIKGIGDDDYRIIPKDSTSK